MKADLLRHEFASEAVPSADGRLLLDPDATLALIDRATEEGVPIVALRGVAAAGAGAPVGATAAPADSADYAHDVAEGHGCWANADAFVRAHLDRGLVFEVALGGDPIEAV
jgi:hypothetical protein